MRRFLLVAYDVTDLSEGEIDYLAGEAHAQSEDSDGHPSVPAVSGVVDDDGDTFVGVFIGPGVEVVGTIQVSHSPTVDAGGGE